VQIPQGAPVWRKRGQPPALGPALGRFLTSFGWTSARVIIAGNATGDQVSAREQALKGPVSIG